MEFIVWVETRLAGKTLAVQEVARFDRCASGIEPEEIGLTLQEGEDVLRQVQRNIVQTQIQVQGVASSRCMHCSGAQLVKDIRTRQIGTVFGRIKVACRRYIRCTCQGGRPSILWPLGLMELPGSTPELSYLMAKWGSILPYRRAARMLGELLPISDGVVSHATLRRHALAVGARLDQRVTEPDEYDWPESHREAVPNGTRLIVAIDGTYVRSNLDTGLYQHYAVAGRIERVGILAGRFAWIARWPGEAEQFMRAALRANGWTAQTQVVVLADGADGLKNLVQAAVNSEPRSILDWFHISMRLRSIEQMAAKVAVALDEGNPDMAALVRQRLPNVRHQMWNGQWRPAIARMKTIYQGTCETATRMGHAAGEHMQRFRKHLRDLRDYLVNNQASLTNYAHAYRNGLRISSAPAESGMSHVVNQRMGKRQPMCWTAEGAHLLLQVRCAVLDGTLDALFRERYPRFRLTSPALEPPGL
jgi:hypothetical protein